MNAIEIKGLYKRYKDFAIEDLNLELPMGCILGLIGDNGAGKTTTIKLILGMLRKDGGTITVLGQDDPKAIPKEDIGVVLDDVGIPGCLNVRQVGNVMASTFRNWNQERYEGYLRQFALPEKKQFKDFSKGMKMKLGIAVALSHDAKLLILDEATSGLDPVVRDEILDLFQEFTRDETHSILISSHIVSDLEKICDYVAFVHKGRLLLCEEKDRLREEYAIVHCTEGDLARFPEIVGKKKTAYAVEAIVKKEWIPAGMAQSAIDIEQLFIFMAKEAG